MVELKQLHGLELQQALYVWSQSFERGDRVMEDWREWEERLPDGRATFGISDDAGLQAAFLIVDETIHLGPDATVPMGSVCGVGVLPSSRGKGFGSAGVSKLYEIMRERGQAISYLDPFSWDFYGRLGYAWTAPTRRYTVPSRILPASGETDYVRAATEVDRPAVVAAYTKSACRYRGMLARRAQVWNWRFDASKKNYTYTYVYDHCGSIEGYLIYHGGTRENSRLDDFVVNTARAREGLLGLLRRHEMQVDNFTWDAPADDALWSTLVHSSLETKLFTRTMARIVDVPSALRAIKPPAGIRGAVSLSVIDGSAPWNQGNWRVEMEGGGINVSRSTTPPQAVMSVQTLSQAYLGTPTVNDLRAAGKVDVLDEASYGPLRALFDGPPAWCNDSF